MRPFATLLILLHYHLVGASHFRFGTVSWSAVEESYPCTDGEHGPAAIDTPCHLPFSHDNQMHMGCTGHNTTTGSASTDVCTNTCRYPNDQMCDDGGPDSLYAICDYGSDCADCGNRVQSTGPKYQAGATGWCATSSAFNELTHWGSCKTCTRIKKIRLKVHLAYRRSGVGGSKWIRGGDNNQVGDAYSAGILINWGDGSNSMASPMMVSSGGLSKTWSDSLGEFTHDYSQTFLDSVAANGAGFTIDLKSCCRIGTLKNNNNAYYKLSTYVNLTHFRSGGGGVESNQVPMVTVPQSGQAQSFDISGYSESAGTAAQGKLTFSWSSAVEMGLGATISLPRKKYNGDVLGMVLNGVTGELSWVTANTGKRLWLLFWVMFL